MAAGPNDAKALFAGEGPALGQYLNDTFRRMVVRNSRDIHEIVDDIIAQSKVAGGKGKMKSSSGGGGGGGHWLREPQVSPTRAEIKKDAYISATAATRSRIEPLQERVTKAASVGELFEAAASECRDAVQAIARGCRKERKKFFDQEFYFDSQETLYPNPGTPEDCTVAEPRFAMRMGDVYPEAVLFADEISSEDMTQGSVGNCFFVGAVCALASHSSDALQQLFVARDEECGIYGVCFFKNGSWEWVIVDDFIAVNKDRSGAVFPLFCSSGQGGAVELWPLVLEKAYAKMHHNWDSIDGGWAREALVDLTGGLEDSFDLHGKDKGLSFKKFRADVDDPHTVLSCAVGEHVGSDGAATGSAGEAGAMFGLFHGHQYSVIGAAECPDGRCFVQVRNPWGNDAEWQGPYSDNDSAWRENPEHFRHIQPNFGNDGCFWMLWSDFKEYFTEIDVVRKFPREFQALTLPFQGERVVAPENTFAFRVFKQPAEVTIVFSQEDPKVSRDHEHQKTASYKTVSCSLTSYAALPQDVLDLESIPHQTLAKVKGRQRAVSFTVKLDPGVYCIKCCLRTKAKDAGVFLRIFGPPESDFAVHRWSEGEGSAIGVGEWREKLVQAVEEEQETLAINPPGTGTAVKPVASVVVTPRQEEHADPAANAATAGRAGDSRQTQAYVDQLETLVADLQAQLAEARASSKTAASSRAASAARAQSTQDSALSRLGMDRGALRDAARQVFDELSSGDGTVDRATAVNGMRLVVTLGAGMDDVFLDTHRDLCGDRESLSGRDFVRSCEECVNRWAVLQ
jgi:hypothetical protein